MQLLGRRWTRAELEQYVGQISQIAGVNCAQLPVNASATSEDIQVRTGAGLTYHVNPCHNLDIAFAEFCGVPISKGREKNTLPPTAKNDTWCQWFQRATAGFLATRFLTKNSSPHRQNTYSAVRKVTVLSEWIDNEYQIQIRGRFEGINSTGLCLTRVVRSRIGENAIAIDDRVTNMGTEAIAFGMFYQFNLGFPFLSSSTTIELPAMHHIPKTADTLATDAAHWAPPLNDAPLDVYYHEQLRTDRVSCGNKRALVTVSNPTFPTASGAETSAINLKLSWNTDSLPRLIQARSVGRTGHVLSLIAAGCYLENLMETGANKAETILQPGESRDYNLLIAMDTPLLKIW